MQQISIKISPHWFPYRKWYLCQKSYLSFGSMSLCSSSMGCSGAQLFASFFISPVLTHLESVILLIYCLICEESCSFEYSSNLRSKSVYGNDTSRGFELFLEIYWADLAHEDCSSEHWAFTWNFPSIFFISWRRSIYLSTSCRNGWYSWNWNYQFYCCLESSLKKTVSCFHSLHNPQIRYFYLDSGF